MNDKEGPKPVRRHSSALQWGALALLTTVICALFEWAALPAALLIGSMIAGIVIGVRGGGIAVHKSGFAAGQAVIGVLIASALTPDIFPSLAANWPIFLGAVVATLAASSFLGWLISRWRILPGTVGVWGSAPGASTAMVLMAGAFGADQRLVAFMQYLRVIMVSFGAALIARIWIDTSGVEVEPTIWFPPLDIGGLGLTVAVAAAGGLLGALCRLPSPYFLGSFIFALVLHLGFDIDFHLPEWMLAASYVAIGWTIGLRFQAETLRHAARALPQVVASILALMAFCGAIAWLLVHELGVDPLTAYLATSPGGMDTVAIIAAASTGVDISFIMTMQAIRFLVVLVFGGAIARLVASLVKT